jgi:hypothetical protein
MVIENGTDPGKFGEVYVVLPGRGHWVQQERLGEVNTEMIGFLRCERRRWRSALPRQSLRRTDGLDERRTACLCPYRGSCAETRERRVRRHRRPGENVSLFHRWR